VKMCFLCKFAKNKTTSGEAAVGTDIPVESIFWENNVKYLVNEGQATSLTVTKDGDNTLNIYVTPAALYTCMVNLKANSELLVSNSSSIYAEESSTIYYSKAYNKDGKWYVTNANNDQPYYGVTFNTVTEDNTVDITSFAENTSILYFAEAEDMSINGGFAEVTGAVAANTGLVLQGKSAAIPVATSGTEYTDNLLVAVSADQTVDAGYVLSVQEGNVVFAPIADTKPTVKAGQAYLKASDSAVNALSIVFGDATAISEVANNIVTKGECYDLTGRKVNLQSQKGIFIINGKKIVRK